MLPTFCAAVIRLNNNRGSQAAKQPRLPSVQLIDGRPGYNDSSIHTICNNSMSSVLLRHHLNSSIEGQFCASDSWSLTTFLFHGLGYSMCHRHSGTPRLCSQHLFPGVRGT